MAGWLDDERNSPRLDFEAGRRRVESVELDHFRTDRAIAGYLARDHGAVA